MNSWTVTWGILQALAVLAAISLAFKLVTSDWFMTDLNGFKLIVGLIIGGGLLLITVLKAGER